MILEKALVWFRRDLRDHDHAALSAALAEARQVYCAFVFDRDILEALPAKHDRRVHFIHESLVELDVALRAKGGGLVIAVGIDAGYAEFAGKPGDFLAGPTMTDDQAATLGTQGGMVMVTQVATKPDKGFFFFHGWFVPPRRLKFQSWTTSI